MEYISCKLPTNNLSSFNFIQNNFENLDKLNLKNINLIVAIDSIPFCSKNIFNNFWNSLINTINKNRIFRW